MPRMISKMIDTLAALRDRGVAVLLVESKGGRRASGRRSHCLSRQRHDRGGRDLMSCMPTRAAAPRISEPSARRSADRSRSWFQLIGSAIPICARASFLMSGSDRGPFADADSSACLGYPVRLPGTLGRRRRFGRRRTMRS